jgi:activator of HSP90 ATPase
MNGFTLSEVIAAKPEEIYRAWLSSEGHTAMTGSPAVVEGQAGGEFSAWDGYIFGRTLALTPNRQIIQTWRTSEFPDDASDSRLDVDLEEVGGGTKITLKHSNLPANQVDSYRQGWEDFYFVPMREYFRSKIPKP